MLGRALESNLAAAQWCIVDMGVGLVKEDICAVSKAGTRAGYVAQAPVPLLVPWVSDVRNNVWYPLAMFSDIPSYFGIHFRTNLDLHVYIYGFQACRPYHPPACNGSSAEAVSPNNVILTT